MCTVQQIHFSYVYTHTELSSKIYFCYACGETFGKWYLWGTWSLIMCCRNLLIRGEEKPIMRIEWVGQIFKPSPDAASKISTEDLQICTTKGRSLELKNHISTWRTSKKIKHVGWKGDGQPSRRTLGRQRGPMVLHHLPQSSQLERCVWGSTRKPRVTSGILQPGVPSEGKKGTA